MATVNVLFVCMGNICRSPTAEGVLLKLLSESGRGRQVAVDSAGTLDYHTGNGADTRAVSAALKRGIDLRPHRARQVAKSDYESYDYILAMDQNNLTWLKQQCPAALRGKLRLLLEFAPDCGVREVPDPYYGEEDGFERVLDLVDTACRNLLIEIDKRIGRDGRPG